MFNKNNLIQIDKEDIRMNQMKNKIFSKNNINILDESKAIKKHEITNMFKADIKNRNIYMLLEEEKVFIKLIRIPKVKEKFLDDLINNQIKYYFKNDKDIIYTYNIYKENKKTLEVLLFCINCQDVNVIESFLKKHNNIKAIWVVQMCFLKYFNKNFHENKCILSFVFNNNLYFLCCKNENMINNDIIKNFHNYDLFSKYLKDFLLDCKRKGIVDEFKKIYIANFEEKITKKNEEDYLVHDIGKVSKEQFINCINKDG